MASKVVFIANERSPLQTWLTKCLNDVIEVSLLANNLKLYGGNECYSYYFQETKF